MADKKTPNPNFTPLRLKNSPHGEEMRLVKDFNRICDAEQISGCNLFKVLAGGGDISSCETRAMLFACLLEWNPKVTLEECGDLLGGEELPEILIALGKALGKADAEPEAPESIDELPIAATVP